MRKIRISLLATLIGMLTVWCGFAQAEKLELPASVTVIEAEAFYGDQSLDEVVLPEGIKRIEELAFASSSVKKVNLPDSLEYIAYNAFDRGQEISFAVNEETSAYDWWLEWNSELPTPKMEDYRFAKNEDGTCTITKYTGNDAVIMLPATNAEGDAVSEIGAYAFNYNSNLVNVIIPAGVKEIHYQAFGNCYNLTGITLPESIVRIGAYAFKECYNLTKITLPESIVWIDSFAFGDCKLLSEVDLPDAIETIGWSAFSSKTQVYARMGSKTAKETGIQFRIRGTGYDLKYFQREGSQELELGLVKVDSGSTENMIISGVTTICEGAFKGYSAEVLYLPDSLRRIESYAFAGSSVKKVYGLTHVETVEDYGFNSSPFTGTGLNECSLTELYELNSLTSVGTSVFRGDTTVYVSEDSTGALTLSAAGYAFTAPYTNYEQRYILEDGVVCGRQLVKAPKDETGFTLPDGFTSIAAHAFWGCAKLNDVYLPDSIEEIENEAFDFDMSWHIYFPRSYNTHNYAEIGSNLSHLISDSGAPFTPPEAPNCYLMYRNEELTLINADDGSELVIPYGVERIMHLPISLIHVDIPASVKTIDEEAFWYCDQMVELSIPDSVTCCELQSIPQSLRRVRVPGTINKIAGDYWSYLISSRDVVEEIYISNQSTVLDWDRIWKYSPGQTKKNLKAVYIPASITEIKPARSNPFYYVDAIYCPQGSYIWNYLKRNGGEARLHDWDETYFESARDGQLSGRFTEESMTILIGEKVIPAGKVSSPSRDIQRVTITVNDWNQDGTNANRYATYMCSGLQTREINLNDWDYFEIDTTKEPFNEPGEYTINLWASLEEGKGVKLDSMTVTVSTRLGAPNIIYPSENNDVIPFGDINVTWDTVPGAGYYVISLRELDTDELILCHYSLQDATNAILSASYFPDDADYRVAVGAVPAGCESTDPRTGWTERVFHVSEQETSAYTLVTSTLYGTDVSLAEVTDLTVENAYGMQLVSRSADDIVMSGVTVEAYKITTDKAGSGEPEGKTVSDKDGHFELVLPSNTRYRLTFSKNGYNFHTDTIIYTQGGMMNIDYIFLRTQQMLKYGTVDLTGMQAGLFAEYFTYVKSGNGYDNSSKNKRNEGAVSKIDFNWIHSTEPSLNYNIMTDTVSGKSIRYIGKKFAAHFSGYLSISSLLKEGNDRLYFRVLADDGIKIKIESGEYHATHQMDHDDWEKMSFANNTDTRIEMNGLTGAETFEIAIDYYNKGGDAMLRMEYSEDGENWLTVPEYCYYNKGAAAQRTVETNMGEALAVSTWLLSDDIAMRTYSQISGDVKDSKNVLHTAGSKLALSIQDWIRNTTYEAMENNSELVIIASANAGTEIKLTDNPKYKNTEQSLTDGVNCFQSGKWKIEDALQEGYDISKKLVDEITGNMKTKQKQVAENVNKVLARICYRELIGSLPDYKSTNTAAMWKATWEKAETLYNSGNAFQHPAYSGSNSIEQMEYLCANLYGTGNSAAAEHAGNILLKFNEDSKTIQSEYGYNLGDYMWNLCEKVPLLGKYEQSLHEDIDIALELKKVLKAAKGDAEVSRAMLSLAFSEKGQSVLDYNLQKIFYNEAKGTNAVMSNKLKSTFMQVFITSGGTIRQVEDKDHFDRLLDTVGNGSVTGLFNSINGIDPEYIVHNELLYYSWKYMKQELTGMLNE